MGKIRLVQTPWANHSWHVALYLTAQGLTTSPIPYAARAFEIEFDFLDHRLRIKTSEGRNEALELAPRAVASFYEELFARLTTPGLEIRIRNMPNEIPDATDRVLKAFRSRFIGKSSPVHFFWVSFDVAVTRFSGRRAPPHPGGVPNLPDRVAREAYSHEVSSCGFWPGNDAMPYPVFYAYAYPEPDGFKTASLRPAGAQYKRQPRRVCPALRRGSAGNLARCDVAGFPAEQLRGGGRSRRVGSAGVGTGVNGTF